MQKLMRTALEIGDKERAVGTLTTVANEKDGDSDKTNNEEKAGGEEGPAAEKEGAGSYNRRGGRGRAGACRCRGWRRDFATYSCYRNEWRLGMATRLE